MSVPTWQPGTLYQPNALVVPLTAPPVAQSALTNGDFEAGDTGWTKGTGWVINNVSGSFDGTYAGSYPSPASGAALITNNNTVPVVPGLVINAQVKVNTTGNSVSQGGAAVRVIWYDSGMVMLSGSEGNIVRGGGNNWYTSGVSATAPASAAFAAFAVNAFRNSGPHNILIDAASWDYTFAAAPDGLIFKAIQADAAYSAGTEPVWPTILGNTVVDGGVTWQAVQTTRVVWEASNILVSGSSEPTFSTTVGGVVADNTIGWKAISRQINDPKCPNTIPVAIAASKIFAGDRDIIPFCATINPLDWSSKDDAGYLGFGLQTYGSQPVTALGLYRGNLVAFNSLGFQMWQVDADPANMALLDSVPVSCTFPKTVQPLANDLLFLNAKGVRNISIAGASTNLQADGVGAPVDSLVKVKIKAAEFEPIALYWPFTGQYWLIFGDEAFILTINGTNKKSWSRYTFPHVVTDWTIDGNDLCLRLTVDNTTDVIWRMDADAVLDDIQDPLSVFTVGPPLAEAIHAESLGDYVELAPSADVNPFTACGWARLVGTTGGFRCVYSYTNSSGANATNLIYADFTPQLNFTNPNSSLFTESPDRDRWFFWAIVNDGVGPGVAKWCYLGDSSFTVNRTKAGVGVGSPNLTVPNFASVGGYIDGGGPFACLTGDFCQLRQWQAALNDAQLLAEKDSPTLVLATAVFASNPFQGVADMSDESGNARVGIPHGSLTDVADGPGN